VTASVAANVDIILRLQWNELRHVQQLVNDSDDILYTPSSKLQNDVRRLNARAERNQSINQSNDQNTFGVCRERIRGGMK